MNQQITINDLPELTGTVEDEYMLPIDDGEITKKVSVGHFEEAASATARQYAEAAEESATASATSAGEAAQSAIDVENNTAAAAQAATDARNAATRAAGSADAAAAADVSAQRNASAAATSANASAASAATAGQNRDDAIAAGNRAASWADYPGQTGMGNATNNAHFWADQARASITGVASWNGRAGYVMPEDDDYDLSMMGDTYISDPADGDALEYDSTSGKWKPVPKKMQNNGANAASEVTLNSAVSIGSHLENAPVGKNSFTVGKNIAACGEYSFAQGAPLSVQTSVISTKVYSASIGDTEVQFQDLNISYVGYPCYVEDIDTYGYLARIGSRSYLKLEKPLERAYAYLETITITIYKTTSAAGESSIAVGDRTRAAGNWSYASGESTFAFGSCAHAEGNSTTAKAPMSHAEGSNTLASGSSSHAEGERTTASRSQSHAEGLVTTASGSSSHAEGYYTTASGESSHAEGSYTEASGSYSHAEGDHSKASGDTSHAEGNGTTASAEFSHAEGNHATANGSTSHAEGSYTTASHQFSHAEGRGTLTGADCQHVQGKYNIGRDDTLFEIGNGTAEDARHNAFEVYEDGRVGINGPTPDIYKYHITNTVASTAVAWCNKTSCINFGGKHAVEGEEFTFVVGLTLDNINFDPDTGSSMAILWNDPWLKDRSDSGYTIYGNVVTSVTLFDKATKKQDIASANLSYCYFVKDYLGYDLALLVMVKPEFVTSAVATAINAVVDSQSPGFGCVYAANTIMFTGTCKSQGLVEQIPGLAPKINTLPGMNRLTQHVGDFYFPTGGNRWRVEVEVDPGTAYYAVMYLENTTTGAYFCHGIAYVGVPTPTLAAPTVAPAPVAGKTVTFIGTTWIPFIAGVAGVIDEDGVITKKPRLVMVGYHSNNAPTAGLGMHLRLFRIY